MSWESCSDKETEAGLTSECWTTLHILYPAWELSTLLFVFTIQCAYDLQCRPLKQWSGGELLWAKLPEILQWYNVVRLKNICREISVTEVINVIVVCVERLRTQGGFNLWVAVIWFPPESYTKKAQKKITQDCIIRPWCLPFKWSVTFHIVYIISLSSQFYTLFISIPGFECAEAQIYLEFDFTMKILTFHLLYSLICLKSLSGSLMAIKWWSDHSCKNLNADVFVAPNST